MKYFVKLICGYRRDQEHIIPAREAHKAYYLFNNPDKRSTFSNGLAIRGDQIQEIVPAYQHTMGWNEMHVLDQDDYNELAQRGVMSKMQRIMSAAKEIAQLGAPEDLNTPLAQLVREKYQRLFAPPAPRLGTQDVKSLLPQKQLR